MTLLVVCFSFKEGFKIAYCVYLTSLLNLLQSGRVPKSLFTFHDIDSFEESRPVILENVSQFGFV